MYFKPGVFRTLHQYVESINLNGRILSVSLNLFYTHRATYRTGVAKASINRIFGYPKKLVLQANSRTVTTWSASTQRGRYKGALLFGGLCSAGAVYLLESYLCAGPDCIDGDHGIEAPSQYLENIEAKSKPKSPVKVQLYQYQTCPFCCKVRAFLDYYGIEYEKVEVNPLFKKEIKFSDYRKVPIAMVDGIQLNDSSRIISIIRSHMLGKETLEELLQYYPVIQYENTKKKDIEYANRNFLMFHKGAETKERQMAIREEMKWRTWVDHTFVHTLSPNIYRTMKESFAAFEYFSSVGNFGTFERSMVQYTGAITMYFLGKFLKRRYQLKDDVRQSMYDEARRWTKAIGKNRKFMGGDMPNLADLATYGVLSGIEGLEVFNDLMKNTDMKPWYYRVKKMVHGHKGKDEMIALLASK